MNPIESQLLRLRNRFAPGNRRRLGKATLEDQGANLLHTRVHAVGRNQIVFEPGARLRHLFIEIQGESNVLHIGRDSIVAGRIELHGDGNEIRIGAGTRINGAFLGAHNGTSILIGSQCLFSTEIDIRTTDSHGIYDSRGVRVNPDRDIVIADRVWLGIGVTVLKGSWIESGSVVGARSLVAGRLPGQAVAAGVPAKVLRTGVTWGD